MIIYMNVLNHKASFWTCSSSAGNKGQLEKQQDGKDDDDNDNDDDKTNNRNKRYHPKINLALRKLLSDPKDSDYPKDFYFF